MAEQKNDGINYATKITTDNPLRDLYVPPVTRGLIHSMFGLRMLDNTIIWPHLMGKNPQINKYTERQYFESKDARDEGQFWPIRLKDTKDYIFTLYNGKIQYDKYRHRAYQFDESTRSLPSFPFYGYEEERQTPNKSDNVDAVPVKIVPNGKVPDVSKSIVNENENGIITIVYDKNDGEHQYNVFTTVIDPCVTNERVIRYSRLFADATHPYVTDFVYKLCPMEPGKNEFYPAMMETHGTSDQSQQIGTRGQYKVEIFPYKGEWYRVESTDELGVVLVAHMKNVKRFDFTDFEVTDNLFYPDDDLECHGVFRFNPCGDENFLDQTLDTHRIEVSEYDRLFGDDNIITGNSLQKHANTHLRYAATYVDEEDIAEEYKGILKLQTIYESEYIEPYRDKDANLVCEGAGMFVERTDDNAPAECFWEYQFRMVNANGNNTTVKLEEFTNLIQELALNAKYTEEDPDLVTQHVKRMYERTTDGWESTSKPATCLKFDSHTLMFRNKYTIPNAYYEIHKDKGFIAALNPSSIVGTIPVGQGRGRVTSVNVPINCYAISLKAGSVDYSDPKNEAIDAEFWKRFIRRYIASHIDTAKFITVDNCSILVHNLIGYSQTMFDILIKIDSGVISDFSIVDIYTASDMIYYDCITTVLTHTWKERSYVPDENKAPVYHTEQVEAYAIAKPVIRRKLSFTMDRYSVIQYQWENFIKEQAELRKDAKLLAEEEALAKTEGEDAEAKSKNTGGESRKTKGSKNA